MYMVVSNSAANTSFITRKYGMMLEWEAIELCKRLNRMMDCYFSQIKYHITPVLDV